MTNHPDLQESTGITSSRKENEALFMDEEDWEDILPAEQVIFGALGKASHQFFALARSCRPYPEASIQAFQEGINRAQLAAGTVRLGYTFCQKQKAETDETSRILQDLPKTMRSWGEDFKAGILFRRYPKVYQSLLERLLLAWEQMQLLALAYPNRHACDEFRKALIQCERSLSQIHARTLACC